MNLNNRCNNLDAYLSDDLTGDERANFESHVEECSACRDAAEQQHWIDNLLHSPERVQIEQPSVTVLDSFRVSLAQRQRRVLQAACGLAAAATLLIAVGLVKLNPQANGPLKSEERSVAVTEPAPAPTPAQPPATFVSSSDAIVVPVESPSTDVTIVQVYPTTDAERRWRLEQSLLSATTEPNGG
jgi:anti-sigma factor RsiW